MSPSPPSWPAAVAAIFRHQLRLLLHSRLTLVFQLAFLTALTAATFLVGDFFAANEAALDTMLGFLPWIALVFVPALAMKTFAGRAHDRERELLMTLPLPRSAIALGAWLAGSLALALTLAFTAPFALTVAWLGEPDAGVLAASYLGGFLLLSSFYAVSLFASAAARSEIGAFVIALAILFALVMSGWDGLRRLGLGEGLAAQLQSVSAMSPKFWMERIAAGRLELKALVYFAALTALALAGAAAALGSRPGWTRLALGGAAGVALALAAVATAPSRLAIDLTAQKSVTLAEGTLDLARRLPAGSRIDFYWSAGAPGVPSAVRAYAGQVEDLLRLVTERSGGRISFEAHADEPDAGDDGAAIAAGLRRVPMSSGDAFFLGAVISAGERRIPIAYFDQRREAQLEYDIATALSGLARARPPKVGVISPLLAPGDPTAAETGFNAIAELRRAYDVAVIPPFADRLPDGLDALVVIGATFLKREMLYSIDQGTLRGMGLIVMIDPRLRLSPAGDRAAPTPSEDVDDISDLLLAYGIRYRGDAVVGDAAIATPVADASQTTIAFPYWMRFGRDRISGSHAVTSSLGDLLFVEPGALEAAPSAALATTTDAAGAASGRDLAEKTPAAAAASFAPGGGARMVAAEVDGPFRSAFRAVPPGLEAPAHVARGERPSAVFAVADIDWILDPFAYEPQFEPGAARKPRNDNVALFLNMVERAAGGGELIAIRSRGQVRRPLERVAALAKEASRAERDGAAAAMSRLAEVERRIAALPAAAGVAGLGDLPEDVQRRVAELRRSLAPDRRIVRLSQARERDAVEALRARVILLNLAGGPALAFAFAGLVALARRRAA